MTENAGSFGSDAPDSASVTPTSDQPNVVTDDDCTCKPCESPAYGAPGYDHCAACCFGLMVEEYDHGCPITEHQRLAVAQFGPLVEASDG